MRKLSHFYLACLVGALLSLALNRPAVAASITAYTPQFRAVVEEGGGVQCLIRTFNRGGKSLALLVNPWTLKTRIVLQSEIKDVSPIVLAETPYSRTLQSATALPVRLQNHGLTHASQNVAGQFLTVDLCPSKRPFEQAFFETVAALGQPLPVPVTVAITGVWLNSHEKEFSWLREQDRQGRLAITWVNHSMTHPYDAAAPLFRTFLLTPGLDLRKEVLGMEILLLEHDVLPAPFFRFPGLVADEAALRLVRELGLIPLGSNAWLAKGEQPQEGSIMLVHGNGNEPAGIRRFHELRQQALLLRLLPLPDTVVANRSP